MTENEMKNLKEAVDNIFTNYPESIKVFRDWWITITEIKSQKLSPSESLLKHLLYLGIRNLYDFFDSREIYVSTIHDDLGFIYKVNHDFTGDAETRSQLEIKAFEKAFSILENQLKNGR